MHYVVIVCSVVKISLWCLWNFVNYNFCSIFHLMKFSFHFLNSIRKFEIVNQINKIVKFHSIIPLHIILFFKTNNFLILFMKVWFDVTPYANVMCNASLFMTQTRFHIQLQHIEHKIKNLTNAYIYTRFISWLRRYKIPILLCDVFFSYIFLSLCCALL